MKRLFVIALFALSMGTSAFAKSTGSVSKSATSNFKADFKNASDVSWTATDSYAKASFTMDGKQMEAFYNSKGEVIGTSTHVGLQELPASATKAIAKKFQGYTAKEAIRFEGTEESGYYISLENEKEAVILKASENNQPEIFKRTKK
jgi:hypothetical protein